MANITSFLQLIKPTYDRTGWGQQINNNFETIDSVLKEHDIKIDNIKNIDPFILEQDLIYPLCTFSDDGDFIISNDTTEVTYYKNPTGEQQGFEAIGLWYYILKEDLTINDKDHIAGEWVIYRDNTFKFLPVNSGIWYEPSFETDQIVLTRRVTLPKQGQDIIYYPIKKVYGQNITVDYDTASKHWNTAVEAIEGIDSQVIPLYLYNINFINNLNKKEVFVEGVWTVKTIEEKNVYCFKPTLDFDYTNIKLIYSDFKIEQTT